MLKENDKVYFVDLNSGEMIEGFLSHNDNGHFKKLLIKFNDNNMFKLFVKRELVGSSQIEAYKLFDLWKVKYREELLKGNKWINDLFESWVADRCEYGFKEGQKIMKSVILEKTGIKIE